MRDVGPARQETPVIRDAAPTARLSGTSLNSLTKSRLEALLACGSHRFGRDDG
jgi:hypothetical protein